MPPLVALLDPPAVNRVTRSRLIDEIKLFAPIAGTSVRNASCPPSQGAKRGAVYFISRTNSPFAKTRKIKNAMKKAKTFTPMK